MFHHAVGYISPGIIILGHLEMCSEYLGIYSDSIWNMNPKHETYKFCIQHFIRRFVLFHSTEPTVTNWTTWALSVKLVVRVSCKSYRPAQFRSGCARSILSRARGRSWLPVCTSTRRHQNRSFVWWDGRLYVTASGVFNFIVVSTVVQDLVVVVLH